MRDFVRWLHTDTPYPNPPYREIVDNVYFVVHELVEIAEVRRRGLRITKDVILRHPGEISDAHLQAARVEFDAAFGAGDRKHFAARVRDLRSWCEDPVLTDAQRREHRALLTASERRARDMDRRARDGRAKRE